MGGLDVVVGLVKVAAVFGLLFVTLRVLAKHQGGRTRGRGNRLNGGAPPAALVEILDQSRVGRSASIAAVRVGDRAFLLGITEEQVATLADLSDDLDLTTADEPEDDDGSRQSVLDHAVDLLKSGTFRR